MSFTHNKYKLIELKQSEDRVIFTIELEAELDVREAYLNNYYEGLYIQIGKSKYNIYAEIQEKYIVGELLYEVVANNATGKKDKNRLWIRNRIGNTYIEEPVYINCKESILCFGQNRKYEFISANHLEWYFCKYTNELNGKNPFENEGLEDSIRQITDVKIETQEKNVFVYGTISFDEIEQEEKEFCLVWKEVKNKKNYYFHNDEMRDGEFLYQITKDEIEQFGKGDIEGKVFEWGVVDSKGQEYRLVISDSLEIENLEISAQDFTTEMSRTSNNTVQMRTLSSIYFDFLDVSENGNEMIVEFRKKTYDLTLESVIAQKVNTDIEYQLPFSIISENEDKIMYSIKLQIDIDEEDFKIGVHQFWVEVRDGIFIDRYPMRLLRKRRLTENTYLISKHPYALVNNNYYNCLFYNDTSSNLKCNIIPKVLKIQITMAKVISNKIKLGVSVRKEPFFNSVTNVRMLAENNEEICLDYAVTESQNENKVEIDIPAEKLCIYGVNSFFSLQMAFEGRSQSVKVENNMYRPAVNNRETRAFSSILKTSDGVFRRIWGNHVKGSYMIGASENLQLLCEKAIWFSEEKLFIKAGWSDEIALIEYKDMPPSLYLKNKITEEEIKLEKTNGAGDAGEEDGITYEISNESFAEGEFVVCAEFENGMRTYLEMTSPSMTTLLYEEKKKVQLKKKEGYLEIIVDELLIFEDESRVRECNEIIQKAREENTDSNRKIWLVGENYGLSARDNGLAFFEYCMKNKATVDAEVYFVTKKENQDIACVEQYRENVLVYDSPEHIYYDELAEFYIVSHGIRDVMPSLYHNKTGVYHKPIIYLQHGIAAMKKFDINNKSYGGSIRKFIVSSEQEKELLVDNKQFWEDEITNTGLARYDKLLSENSASGKYIWIMPTWRDWLVKSEDRFTDSEFYVFYSSVLCDTELIELLRKKEQKLVLSLHIEFEKYKPYFDKFENDVVHITDMHEESINNRIEECSMIVTDYSSIIFDVVYLNKPVVFFQFDQNLYSRYRSSYVDLEKDLPGAVTHTMEELKKELLIQISNKFETSQEYKDRSKHYFDYHDCNNSERIYKAIMECREEMADEYQY